MAKLPTDTIEEFEQYQLDEPSNGSQSNIENTPNGSVLATGELASPNFVSGRTGWRMDAQGNFEAVNGTFSGTLTAVSLNIPDKTTANSFHVDSSGNVWWGTNLATSYPTAPAYILPTGAAHFENVEIGGTTIQYVITNSGIFSFGDGSDGDVTISVDTNLSSDKYYNNLTIDAGKTLNPSGYRIFVKNTLTLNGVIARNGNNGSAGDTNGSGTNATMNGGAGGAALSDGYLKGSAVGGAGGSSNATGSPPVIGNFTGGANGPSTTNSIGTSGVGGGGGGNGLNSIGGATNFQSSGGSGGTATGSNVKLIANWHLATLLDVGSTGTTVKFNNSGGGAGGGCGSYGQPTNGSNYSSGGGGGGGGSTGGIIAIYARSVVISASGSITATGGNGGAGGGGASGNDAFGGGSGGGGGGGGGNGGIIILVYNSLSNSGSITAAGGTGGTAGAGGTAVSGRNGSNGTAGTNGSAGTIYQFQLSL